MAPMAPGIITHAMYTLGRGGEDGWVGAGSMIVPLYKLAPAPGEEPDHPLRTPAVRKLIDLMNSPNVEYVTLAGRMVPKNTTVTEYASPLPAPTDNIVNGP